MLQYFSNILQNATYTKNEFRVYMGNDSVYVKFMLCMFVRIEEFILINKLYIYLCGLYEQLLSVYIVYFIYNTVQVSQAPVADHLRLHTTIMNKKCIVLLLYHISKK